MTRYRPLAACCRATGDTAVPTRTVHTSPAILGAGEGNLIKMLKRPAQHRVDQDHPVLADALVEDLEKSHIKSVYELGSGVGALLAPRSPPLPGLDLV